MSKKKKGKAAGAPIKEQTVIKEKKRHLHPETTKSIWAVLMGCAGILLALAYWRLAGPAGDYMFRAFDFLLGWGYFLLPITLLVTSGMLLLSHGKRVLVTTAAGGGLFVLAVLGLIEIASKDNGGLLGKIFGSLQYVFGTGAAALVNVVIALIAVIVATNTPLKIAWPLFGKERENEVPDIAITEPENAPASVETVPVAEKQPKEVPEEAKKDDDEEEEMLVVASSDRPKTKGGAAKKFHNYVPPPISLLKSSVERPTTGDLRGNANIIKRTLESFGIAVEMGEINIGPKVTRYTLKPAEGMKLSRITGLSQDLALALAAHPIRIEAPIPGKSLVGIEVPNKTAALVRLGNLMAYQDFQNTGPLSFALGRDVNGEPVFPNISKMPHLLVAGATGSGKSILVHAILISLLYKNSPSTLKMVLIDPKKVELSMYEKLPHLAGPVITDNKKALGVFRWAISQMEHRYELFAQSKNRDIKSYNEKFKDDALPFILIVVDEMADLMASYGREVEGSIIRLAQMARATGIHLILSTQRPSVEVITGLIKANITNRIALQVASQIDSRTILDASGAEKLLGGGDLLFVSQELSKPRRIQASFITEEEIAAVTDFIKENNQAEEVSEVDESIGEAVAQGEKFSNEVVFDDDLPPDDQDDELYHEAVAQVFQAKRASSSLLQRRLKVGYARAARLIDLMEQNGLVGPGEGAKQREIYLEKFPQLD